MWFASVWRCVLYICLVQLTTRTMSMAISECSAEISGIYLRKYLDNADLSLLFYFPLGGVLEFSSNEKVNSSSYFSDTIGLYTCKKYGNGNAKMVSFNGLSSGESGNKTIVLTQATVRCRGATSSSSDDIVSCLNGKSSTQEYAFKAPDQTTGKFTNPISPKFIRQFRSRRLFTHPTVHLTSERNKCYSDMSGIYVRQYSDGSYDLTGLLPLGFFFTVVSNGRNKDGTFNRGTSVGKCLIDGTK